MKKSCKELHGPFTTIEDLRKSLDEEDFDDFHNIKNMIFVIRNIQVMLDSDLARIYGYSTKAFNQQVKNNIERFPDDLMFELTLEEAKVCSRSKFLTLNKYDARGKKSG